MKKYDEVARDYDEITDALMSDSEELMRFLDFSSQMYKVRFADAALTYIQNPAATKVADLPKWNKLGRYVKRKTHSIGVFGEGRTVRHLYDVTQTFGKDLPELWKLDKELGEQLLTSMSKEYGKDFENLEEALKEAALKSVNDHMQTFEYICEKRDLSIEEASRMYNTVLAAVQYTVFRRAELNGEYSFSKEDINMEALADCHNRDDFRGIFDLAQLDANAALVKIEREVLRLTAIKKEEMRYERTYRSSRRNNLQDERNRTMGGSADAGVDAGRGGVPEPPDRSVGQGMDKVAESASRRLAGEGPVDNEGPLVLHSEGDRRGSSREGERTGRNLSQGQSSSDRGGLYGSSEMGESSAAVLRQDNQGGNNQSSERVIENTDTVIQNNSAVAASEALPLVAVETIKSLIRDDILIATQKNEIIQFFSDNQDFDERTEYVKKLFENNSYSSTFVDGKPAGYTKSDNGLIMWTGTDNHRKSQSGVEWESIQSYIAQMISDDDFIEKKKSDDEQLTFFGSTVPLTDTQAPKREKRSTNFISNSEPTSEIEQLNTSAPSEETKESKLIGDLAQSFNADLIDKGKYLDEKKLSVEAVKSSGDLHIRSFSEQDGQIFAEVMQGEKSSVVLIKRNDEDIPYIEIGGKPYKLTDIQNYDLEQFEIFRSPVTHDVNGYYADDLAEGDTVKLDGELWTVKSVTAYSISLVNDRSEKNIHNSLENKWQETIAKAGFEFVSENTLQIDEPILVESSRSILNATSNISAEIRDKAKKSLIVNLYGGPGAGKSTTALQLVAELKKRGLHAEYVSEVAKELVYAKAFDKLDGSLENQKQILTEQKNRLDMIAGNVEVAVTDSPLLLNMVYLKERNDDYFAEVLSQYNEYNNFNILISRDTSVPFEVEGRIHNLEESIAKDKEIIDLLENNQIIFENFDRDDISKVADAVLKQLEVAPSEKSFAEQENESLIKTPDLHAAFEKLYQNHNFSDQAKLFLERAETQMQRNGYENLSTKLFKIPVFAMNYGSPSRINKLLFDGKLKEIIDEVNGYIGNNNQPELHAEISFVWGEGDWFSESDILSNFAEENPEISFALANAVFEYLDKKQHAERNIEELNAGWYKKTNFTVSAVINGEHFKHEGRFDIGDGKGAGGGSLIDHIRTYNEEMLTYTQYPFNQPEYRERAQRMLDIFIPFLETHAELTAEEQEIFDSFVKVNPIRDEAYIKVQRFAEEQGIPFSEYYSDGADEDFNPYVYDGSMSPEDFVKMQLLNTLSEITNREDGTPYRLIEAFESTDRDQVKRAIYDVLRDDELTEKVYTAILESDYINERSDSEKIDIEETPVVEAADIDKPLFTNVDENSLNRSFSHIDFGVNKENLQETLKYVLAPDDSVNERKALTVAQQDIDILKRISPRKSVLNFTDEELALTESWAERFEQDINKKSPFYRAVNGEWRDNEETTAPIIDVIRNDADYRQIKSDVKSGVVERGVYQNADTNWMIQVSRAGIEDSIRYAFKHNDSITYDMLYAVRTITENCVLLDSQVSADEKNNKALTSAFMHKFYSVCRVGEETYLAKLSVEEFSDSTGGTLKRMYNLQDIKIEPLQIIGLAETQLRPSVYNGTEISISDLFSIVKSYDKDFYVNSADYQYRKGLTAETGTADNSIDGMAHTYIANPADVVEISGTKAKFKANIAAITTLQRIEAENRYATPDEQSVMAKYSGWGGIPQAFDIGNKDWATEYAQLSSLLTEEEYAAARQSTLTSFYTPPEIISGVYQALTRFGFTGGNVLEPAMATGNFFAQMPEEMRENSKRYGIELDSISGRIAKQLFPNDNIQIRGFETATFSDNSFDVVIGNVPFGDYGVNDKKYNKYKFKIHDYFAAKAIDQVKPGGIVAIVTSKFTMDKQDEKCRRYLAERSELIGAVRLPSNAFKNAGTDTTTDILFFKKREEGISIVEENWIKVGETADGIPCNQYFVDNPDMVLGTMAWDERMKGKYGADSKVTTCLADESTPFIEQLRAAISKLDGRISTVEETEEYEDVQDTRNVLPADPSVRNFTHTVIDGKMYFRENEVMTEVSATGKTLDRMFGMHKIRECTLGIINAQSEGCSDEELESRQQELNQVYDLFVDKYGYITDDVNQRCFQEDDDYNTIAALEVYDEQSKTVNKAALFFKRTVKQETIITSVDNEDEALQVSLDRLGKVDIPYMAQLLKSNEKSVIAALGDKIYRDPEKVKDDDIYSGYVDAGEYLSGNVRAKLKIALDYAEKIDSCYAKNAAALEKVLPAKLEAGDINVRIGANWIDLDDYNAFLAEYAQAKTLGYYGHPVVRVLGEYKIDGKTEDKSVAATETYGTSRMSSYEIFERLLNQRDIVVRDRVEDDDGNVTYVENVKETQLAKEKARKMEEAFKEWLWKDIDRREKYVERYNELFNSIRGRDYDGSFQTFPGMNPQIELRPHQKNAIMRAKLNGNTLLAHVVGAGKSFEMYASVMEKKRLGLINKACMVVPKHLVLQTASEWIRLYPNAKLLVARPKDFSADNRKRFIARCVTGDYDGVIMSVQQFERIPMSDEYRQQFIRSEIHKITQALQETDKSERISIKSLEREKQKLEDRLQKLLDTPKDSALCFEQLGFDYLVCDEAHTYKNCFVSTKMSSVKGVQTSAAQKSEDMLMKTQYMNKKYGCNNILFATGTPVSNSMVELYVMQRYLRPDLLEKAGVSLFDDWATTFGEVVTQLEMKPEGNGFRMTNRFSKFVNIPELMQMYKEFADIQTADMINLPGVPNLKGGEPIVVVAKPDVYQKSYMKELAERAEAIHLGKVKPNVDNMLKITNEARNLGLDSRCIYQGAVAAPDSKVMKLIDNVEKIYHETERQKGVQLVFCDIAVNEDAEHFSVYKAIKGELVSRNIPSDEICFAGDAKSDKARADMFKQLRGGEKRVILASTSKLGTGANVQDRVCAIHHLDIPWKPSDLIQQDGRGIRQGNMYGEVAVYHYLTEETFDAYMMSIITNKAKFINQIMTSKTPVRVADDVDDMVLTYSQMQAAASGNPLIMEKIQLDNDIATLKMLKSEHINQSHKLQEMAERIIPQKLESYEKTLGKAKADYKKFRSNYEGQPDFAITIDGKKYDERTAAGEELEKAIIKAAATGDSIKFGSYRGFELTIEKVPSTDLFTASSSACAAILHGELTYSAEVERNNGVGNIRRIENLALNTIGRKVTELEGSVKKCQADLDEARSNYNKPFDRQQELEDKMKRLDIVNAELSGRKIEPDGTVLDKSAMYETPQGDMMEITDAGEHTVIGKLNDSDKTVVAEEPIISDNTIEYRSLQQFDTQAEAKDYAKTVEELSEEKSIADIGADIDKVLQNSKLRPGVFNLVGAREELKSKYTGAEIKSCIALTVLCFSDSQLSKPEYVDWAEVYCQEHGLDYVNMSRADAPCKSHLNLINGFIHRSISSKEISRAVEMNNSHELSEGIKF